MTIDANVYWLPRELFTDACFREEFIRAVPREYDVHARAAEQEDGTWSFVIEKPLHCPNLDYYERDYELERQLEDMDAAGVDRALLKLPGCQEWLTLELCRRINDAMAEQVKKSGGRLAALAVVPPYGDDGCIRELDRCLEELGMKGVQVSAHYGNHYLDDPMFRDFFRAVNARRVPVYVHHTPVPVDCGSLLAYNNLRRSFGRCQDQVTAIGRELFSGMFAELPDLVMVHSMLGGGYFAFKDMLMPRDSGNGRFDVNTDNVRQWLQNNIYYELSHAQPWSRPILRAAVETLGADHILYGSSYPVKKAWMIGGPEYVRSCDLREEDEARILSENARRIYRV